MYKYLYNIISFPSMIYLMKHLKSPSVKWSLIQLEFNIGFTGVWAIILKSIFSNILNGSLVHSVINETTRADDSLLYGASICGKATSNVSCCLGFSSQSWSYPTTTKNIENQILNEYTFTGFVFIWLWLNSIWYKVTCMNVRKASYILNSEQFTQR